MKATTIAQDKTMYMVCNHNNGSRFITEDYDQADAVAEHWDVYGEGETAVSITSMPKAEYARCIARHRVDTVYWTILYSIGNSDDSDDLPF